MILESTHREAAVAALLALFFSFAGRTVTSSFGGESSADRTGPVRAVRIEYEGGTLPYAVRSRLESAVEEAGLVIVRKTSGKSDATLVIDTTGGSTKSHRRTTSGPLFKAEQYFVVHTIHCSVRLSRDRDDIAYVWFAQGKEQLSAGADDIVGTVTQSAALNMMEDPNFQFLVPLLEAHARHDLRKPAALVAKKQEIGVRPVFEPSRRPDPCGPSTLESVGAFFTNPNEFQHQDAVFGHGPHADDLAPARDDVERRACNPQRKDRTEQGWPFHQPDAYAMDDRLRDDRPSGAQSDTHRKEGPNP